MLISNSILSSLFILVIVCVGSGLLLKYLLAPFKANNFTVKGLVCSSNQIEIEFSSRLSIFVSTVKVVSVSFIFFISFR